MSTEKNSTLQNRAFRITAGMINGLWKFIAFSLIFLAITIASIRLFSNEFSRFKPDIEKFLSDKLDRKVTIHSISLEWPPQGPRIQLKHLELAQDKTQPLNTLVIANGNVSINFWKSIYYRDWTTDEINFQGIQATINPELIKNTATVGDTEKQANIINEWLLRQATIEIYDSFLLLTSEEKKKFSYALPILTFHGGETKRQIKAFALTSSGREIELRAEQNNNADAEKKMEFYLHGEKIELEDFPSQLFYPNLPQLKGTFSLELWSEWKENNLTFLLAKTSADEIIIGQSSTPITVSPVTLLCKRINFENLAFTTSEINIEMDNKQLTPFHLQGKKRLLASEKVLWELKGLDTSIQLLANISKNYLPDDLQQWVNHAEPRGEIVDFKTRFITAKPLPDQKMKFNIEFKLNGLHAKQWGKYPGVKNLDIHFLLDNQGGKFKITSKKGELNLAPLFRYPLQLSTLDSEIQLAFEEDLTRLLWKDFHFNSSEMKLDSTGKLEFLKTGGGYMEIVAKIYDGDTNFTPWFLPSGVMSDNLVKYLDDSVNEGRLVSASAIVRGPFSAFPFENEEGVFDIIAQIKDVNFRFLPNWPTIKKLSAELRFLGDQMLITASKGNVAGVHLTKTTAAIKNLGAENSHLLLDITAKGEIQKAMDLLQDSPLENIPDALSVLEFGGGFTTNINMDVTLKGNKKPKITGTLQFNKNSIKLKQPAIPFEKVQGTVRFNEYGLTRGKLKGKLWKQDFTAQLKDHSTSKESIIKGTIKSKIGAIGISQLSGLKSDLIAIGETNILGDMEFKTNRQSQDSQTHLNFLSDLKNLAINLPGVFKKEKETIKVFSLQFDINKDLTAIKGNIENSASILANKTKGNWKGTVFIGKELDHSLIKLPIKNSWQANLNLGDIDLSEWLELSSHLLSTSKSPKGKTPIHLTVNTSNLKAAGFDFGETYFKMDYEENLELSLKSENIDLKLTKNNNVNEPVRIDIQTLNLIPVEKQDVAINENTVQKQISATEDLFKKIKPSSIPAVKLHCENCRYGEQSLGKIDLETLPAGEHLGFEGHWFSEDIFDIEFSGLWKEQHTQLSGKLTSESIEDLSNFWNIASGVKESSIESRFALSWPDSPLDFDSKVIQGKISSSFSEGHIDEVSTKGAQMFSFLSLQNLKRRLTLDFNDVFADGFFYDEISGTFLINNGRAYSSDIHIDGTAADVDISGYTDIVNKEFNQHMVVTPKLSSSLPVLAGWAISPTTAVVALILDKIFFKPALDVVTRIDYKISGSWDEPVLIEVGKQQKEFKLKQESEKSDANETPAPKPKQQP